MRLRKLAMGLIAAAAMPIMAGGTSAYELTIPSIDYRTGPYAPKRTPFANGFAPSPPLINYTARGTRRMGLDRPARRSARRGRHGRSPAGPDAIESSPCPVRRGFGCDARCGRGRSALAHGPAESRWRHPPLLQGLGEVPLRPEPAPPSAPRPSPPGPCAPPS